MLSTAVLNAAVSETPYSPSCNACLVRVSNKRIRNDPYRASVIASSPKPIKNNNIEAATCLPPAAAVRLTDVFGYQGTRRNSNSSISSNPEPAVFAAAVLEDEPMVTAAPPVIASSVLPPISNERYVVVEFKHELCTYLAPFRVSEGDLVVVEADRGEHAGYVKHILAEKPHFNVPCRILRHGNARDEASINDARSREDTVTNAIQKMADNLGLTIRIVDTEFYSDGNKLTVFFASKAQVDFRKLQRQLFREYRCRIWLINFAEVQYRNKHFRNRK